MSDRSKQKVFSGSACCGWLFKRRVVGWLLIALAIILIPFILFRLTSGSRKLVRCDYAAVKAPLHESATGSLQTLRIATWNIAHGRGSGDSNWEQGGDEKRDRINQIAEKIRELDADVVILNEVDFSASWSGSHDQAQQIAKKSGYPICVKQANLDFGFLLGRWYFGNAILSRLPVADCKVVELQPLNEWESWLVGYKRGLSCTIVLPDQSVVSVVGLHLESRGEAIRVEQVDDVARHIGELPSPIIIAGDLNTCPSNFPNSRRNADGINAFDRMIKQTQFAYQPQLLQGSDEENLSAMTYSTVEPKSIIDWVLVSAELKTVDQRVIDSQLSDHRPVVATIHFKK